MIILYFLILNEETTKVEVFCHNMYTVSGINLLFLYSSLFIVILKKCKCLWTNNIPLSCLWVPKTLNKYIGEEEPPTTILTLS